MKTLLILFALVLYSPTILSLSIPPVPLYLDLNRIEEIRTYDTFLANAQFMASRYGTSLLERTKNQKRQSAEAVLTRPKIGFTAEILVGSPSQAFNVILDTGSGDLALAGIDCFTCDPKAPRWNTSSSLTVKSLNKGNNISYGIGEINGSLMQDSVKLAGLSVSALNITNCNIMNNITLPNVSGLMGLGPGMSAASDSTSFVQALLNANYLGQKVFSFYLRPSYDLSPSFPSGGVMTIGGTNTSLYTGDLIYAPLIIPNNWGIKLDAVSWYNITLGFDSNQVAIIDTGTTLISGPADQVAAIYALIPGSQGILVPGTGIVYSYPCNSRIDLSFTFAGVSYPISSRTFNFTSVFLPGETTAQCIGSIIAFESIQDRWIMGEAFLTTVYSSFMLDPPSIGFAKPVNQSSIILYNHSYIASTSTSSSSYSSIISSTTTHPLTVATTINKTSTSVDSKSTSAGAVGFPFNYSILISGLLISFIRI